MLVPAHDELASAGDSTGQKLVVVRIFADGRRQSSSTNDLPIHGDQLNDGRQIHCRELTGTPFGSAMSSTTQHNRTATTHSTSTPVASIVTTTATKDQWFWIVIVIIVIIIILLLLYNAGKKK